jgi:cell division protein FtsI/penicillin-binding protein 2
MVVFPLTLSFVFVGGMLLVALLLLLAAMRGHGARDVLPEDLPVDADRYGPAATNRWLRLIRTGFALVCVAALGVHGYWVFGAPQGDEFTRFAMRDQRNRREAEAGLRGWVFDRTGDPARALVKYRLDGQRIVRDYPLRDSATNVTGYADFIYGSAGFERGYSDYLTKPTSTYNRFVSPAPVGSDVTSTIDADLQREAYALLKGRRGAVVVLSVPNNEVLAIASSPSFDPALVGDETAWKKLNEDAVKAPELSPMTDRALKTYYLPGSTFKVLVTVAAIENGLANERFTCSGGGFVAPRSGRPILDDSGGGHGNIGLADALRVSCNQYFAQMGLKLGQQRLGGVAQRFGIETGPPSALRDRDLWRFKVADPTDFVAAFAPPPARVFMGDFDDEYTPYSLAIESFGQGPNQMTVLQLALIASAVASPDGRLVKPAIEAGVDPVPIGQVCSPETAAAVRAMMRGVVDNGTAARAFAPLAGRVSAGGKTGTAQRDVVIYDPKTLEPKTVRGRDGKEYIQRETSIDALFIGFAPYENPQIAYAVILEDAGHGGTAAAPIAVGMIQKAIQLNLVTAQAAPQARPAPQGRRGAGARR